MKDEHELPASAQSAFESYPHLEPSPAFNRAVLDSLASAQSKRRQSLTGQLEEFLGVGLWQFLGSGALGALLPAVVLGGVLLSGHTPPHSLPSLPPSPTTWPGFSPFGESFRREYEWV